MSKDMEIMASLRAQLTNGHFEPGQRLQPERLRDAYGCSASTLREAFFRLSTEGLVEFRDQRGFRVPRLSPDLQHELTHLRIVLESEGASLSIQHGGVAWEAQLTAAHHKLSHIESKVRGDSNALPLVPLWSSAELEFHQTLISACGSETLKRTHTLIYLQFRQQLITSDRQFGFVPENVAQHKTILDAALDRDETAIRQAIHDHLARNFTRPQTQSAISAAG